MVLVSSIYILVLIVAAVIILYTVHRPRKPKHKVGDILQLYNSNREEWEQPDTFRIEIIKIGKKKYQYKYVISGNTSDVNINVADEIYRKVT